MTSFLHKCWSKITGQNRSNRLKELEELTRKIIEEGSSPEPHNEHIKNHCHKEVTA